MENCPFSGSAVLQHSITDRINGYENQNNGYQSQINGQYNHGNGQEIEIKRNGYKIRIHYVPLPIGIHGCAAPDGERYIILINSLDDPDRQAAALDHELQHIYSGDFRKSNVQEIEQCQRRRERENIRDLRTASVQP